MKKFFNILVAAFALGILSTGFSQDNGSAGAMPPGKNPFAKSDTWEKKEKAWKLFGKAARQARNRRSTERPFTSNNNYG